MSIRVVIAEDSYLVREGVVRLLEAQEGIEVVGACGDFDELLATVDAELPDVVLTDIRMPPTGTDEGVRAANVLREQHPDIGVVMLSQYAEPAYALALLEHGSAGRAYLLKERVSDVDQLLRAIREVADGGSVIDPRIVEGLVEARSRRRDSPLEHLTPRESEVLAEMAQGRNNAGHRGARSACRSGRSRSTSTRCSRSSRSRRRPTGTAGSRRCWSTSRLTTGDAAMRVSQGAGLTLARSWGQPGRKSLRRRRMWQ